MTGASLEVQVNSDFDPLRDRVRYFEHTISAEQTKRQIETFLGEYITDLTTNSYSYSLREDGKLGVKGWSIPLEESYRGAIESCCNPLEQARRFAEYNSYMQIQDQILKDPSTTQVLMSPDRGYGYSYVSIYRPTLNQNNEFEVGVSIHRIWSKLQTQDHESVRKRWEQDPQVHARSLTGTFVDQELFEKMDPKAQEIFLSKQNKDINHTLFNAMTIEGKGTSLLDKELISAYYNNPGDALYAWEQDDKQIREQLIDFDPEIEAFRDSLIQPTPEGMRDSEFNMTIMKGFKELLVKAKVHFDEEAAIVMWGSDAVEAVKQGTVTKKKDQAGGFYFKSASETIQNLQILLQGSCGTVSIGDSTLDQIKQAFQANDSISRQLATSSKEFICKGCKVFHRISVQDGILVSNCRGCGKYVAC